MKRKTISFEDKILVNSKSNFRCAKCGKRLLISDYDFSIDHVIPISRGGSDDTRNLVAMCFECNNTKGNEFVIPRRYYPYLNEDALLMVENYYLDRVSIFNNYSVFYKLFIESLE